MLVTIQDFPYLLNLQQLNGIHVALGHAYSNPIQARTFVHFIAEEIIMELVELLRSCESFSVCMDSSTDKATIEEDMIQVRVLQEDRAVYRFIALKPLAKADAANTVDAIVSALETEGECSNWKIKLVGM